MYLMVEKDDLVLEEESIVVEQTVELVVAVVKDIDVVAVAVGKYIVELEVEEIVVVESMDHPCSSRDIHSVAY